VPWLPATPLLTFLAMLAFAANSLLCRAALRHTGIDPVTFTTLRILSGALATWGILRLRGGGRPLAGSWASALVMVAYAEAFSFAYLTLPAGMGALLLFVAVQATMVLWGLLRGERLGPVRAAGLALALAGLGILLRPGLATPPLGAAALMLCAGVAWGVYSVRGMGSTDPGGATAGNFLRAAPLAVLVSLVTLPRAHPDPAGCVLALLSGALASGLGYILWYQAMRGLRAATAASVQLSVPVLAALAGVVLLGEPFTLRLGLTAVAILAGIGLVSASPRPGPAARSR